MLMKRVRRQAGIKLGFFKIEVTAGETQGICPYGILNRISRPSLDISPILSPRNSNELTDSQKEQYDVTDFCKVLVLSVQFLLHGGLLLQSQYNFIYSPFNLMQWVSLSFFVIKVCCRNNFTSVSILVLWACVLCHNFQCISSCYLSQTRKDLRYWFTFSCSVPSLGCPVMELSSFKGAQRSRCLSAI